MGNPPVDSAARLPTRDGSPGMPLSGVALTHEEYASLIGALKAADAALYIDVATARDIIRNALREFDEPVA